MTRDAHAIPTRGTARLGMRMLYRVLRHPLWVTKDAEFAERSRMEWGEMNGRNEWYLSALGAMNGVAPRLIGRKIAFRVDDDGRLSLTTLRVSS